MEIRTGCKINLGLEITGVLPNGYHTLDSVFYPLARPFDVLEVERREGAGIRVFCDTPGIDLEHNTLTKAYAAFAALLPERAACPGVDVTLRKGIPHGAGLGGGSSDAAALLLWLNSCLETPLTLEELEKAAIKVGADVPFFLHGRPRRVTGIGEVLTPAAVELPDWWLVLVCPPLSVSTPWAYRAYDDLTAEAEKAGDKGLTNPKSKDNETLLVMGKYAGTGTTFRITTENVLQIRNDLEPAVVREYPQLETIRQHLLHSGAACARMSGSGSSMFGLFSARHAAEAAAQSLESQYGKVFVLPMNAGM
ncbi:4-(cytidine 5'-diphospho)-2-C-methyl-D-erythritol kinase [Desulfovibrio piger]|uniref:4-(cytidine 5'-diphospho)-2-C-methyl-D-erythritol kinase n=1 Tax=Desulfovibrio piger TaxID=901 RepID=UPI003A9575B6